MKVRVSYFIFYTSYLKIMLYGKDKTDEFGMTGSQHIQEFMVLFIVFLMLFGCFMKVVFL